jgi:transposase-like protein
LICDNDCGTELIAAHLKSLGSVILPEVDRAIISNEVTNKISAQVLSRKAGDMSTTMEEEFKRWTAKRKAQLVLDILRGCTTVAEASRAYDLPASDIEEWFEDGRKGMKNALRAKRLNIKEHYEKQIRKLREAYGEVMLQMRVRKKYQIMLGHDDK